MIVVNHPDPARFRERAGPWLEREEAVHNLPLGICSAAIEHPDRLAPDSLFLTVEEGGSILACALRTPPQKLVLSRAPVEALQALAKHLASVRLPGVVGPSEEARGFARIRAGLAAKLSMSQRIYECGSVTAPRPCAGAMRVARPEDEALLVDWGDRFREDAGLDATSNIPQIVSRGIADGRMRIWQDGGPVAMAAKSGRTPHGIRVGFVFTPRELRGRGYASNLVADLTREALAGGLRFTFLYTDATNPTSNAIYQRIGYRPVCDSEEWIFPNSPSRISVE